MFNFLKNLFSNQAPIDTLIKQGAVVVDVRTANEFKKGHPKDAIHLPLDVLANRTDMLKDYSHIIVCCQSGMRSSQAKSLLEKKGFQNVTNGGGWQNVARYTGVE